MDRRSYCSRDSKVSSNNDQGVGAMVMRVRFAKERFEARLEVDNREGVAGNSWMSCSVSHMGSFGGNILADNKANNKVPDEVVGAAEGRSSRMDLEDMLDNASGALVESSRAVGGAEHNGRAAAGLNHHLHRSNMTTRER